MYCRTYVYCRMFVYSSFVFERCKREMRIKKGVEKKNDRRVIKIF